MTDEDPYRVLGVADGVSPTELKKAYYRKMREHPPESDPDGYQRVQRAYQTATDSEYPIRRQHGNEIDALMEEAKQLKEKGKWADAIRPLKKVLLLHPYSLDARNQLGLCQIQAAEWEAAKRTFAKLVAQKPDSTLFRVNYAWVFIEEANSMDRNPEAEARLAVEARAQLDEARKLEPDNPAVMLVYAKSYDAQADWPRAIDWAEKAAAARESVDIDDYTYLVRLHALGDRIPAVAGVADRLAKRLTDEGKKAAGGYFAKEAIEFHERHRFDIAHALILCADRLHRDDSNISAICDRWVNAAEAKAQFQRMKNDKEMNPAVRYLCAVYLDQALGSKFDEPIDSIFDKVKEALDTWEAHEIAAAAQRVQRKYQAVYRLSPETFDAMAGVKAPRSARKYPGRSRGPVQSAPPPTAPVRALPLDPAPQQAIPVAEPASQQRDYWQQSPAPVELAPHRGVRILFLGLLGLLCCSVFGYFSVGMGAIDLTKMERGNMNSKGRGLTIIGMILGGIGILIGIINIMRIFNAK